MPLRVIGAGLGRTGTMSMKLALERIGFGPCYHMAEIMMDIKCLPAWQRAVDGDPDWDAIFAGYAATVDYPACTYWRELAEFYPDAKVLLTVRDPDKWFDSTQATIFSPSMRERAKGTPLEPFFAKAVHGTFGDRIDDREFMTEAFKAHNAAVEAAIPQGRLLVYEAGTGWEPLCEFLGAPVPETPFPHANTREELKGTMDATMTGGEAPDLEEMSRRLRERFKERGYSK